MVLPILEYNSTIYNFTTAQNSQKLQRIQNRAIIIITKTDKTTSLTELQNKLKLQPLHRRRQTQLLTLMPTRSTDPRHTQTAHRTTRQISKYYIKIRQPQNITTPKRTLLQRGPNVERAPRGTKSPRTHILQKTYTTQNWNTRSNPHLAHTKHTFITEPHITPKWPSNPSPIVNSSTQDLSVHSPRP